jgi:flagellar hook assembly protein FlgD
VFDLALNVSATDAGDEGPDPDLTYLHTGFPNPFRSSTIIRFSLAQTSHVDLAVYDVAGRLVRSLLARDVGVGYHTADWDGRDDAGRPVRSGVYFCRLAAGTRSQTRKLIRED